MTGKLDKKSNDRYQPIIEALLREDDNKYCADCDAKGPRWASWNIGIFLCIRCAGLHRKLGVHISKVKSVNLDSWTLVQVATMRDMGNCRARLVYEARLPESFRRPHTDTALESFIRAKYEQKRYISPEYVPSTPDLEAVTQEIRRIEQNSKKHRFGQSATATNSSSSLSHPATTKQSATEQKPNSLGISDATAAPIAHEDPWNSQLTDVSTENIPNPPKESNRGDIPQTTPTKPAPTQPSSDLLGLNLNPTPAPTSTVQPQAPATPNSSALDATARSSKDAILALYQQGFGTPPMQSMQPPPPPYTQLPAAGLAFGQGATDWTQGHSGGASLLFDAFQSGIPSGHPVAAVPIQSMPQFNPMTTNPHPQTYTQSPISTSQFGSFPHDGQHSTHPGFQNINQHIPMYASHPQTVIPQQQPTVGAHLNMASASSHPNFGAHQGLSAASAHQAYLAQVQSQLASMELNNTVVHRAQ